MLALLTAALCLCSAPAQATTQAKPLPRRIYAGWTDELDQSERWSVLASDNKATTLALKEGELFLALGHVPANWPYGFQWSGVTRDIRNNIARFPVLMARATLVKGYAHIDIDVLDAKGNPVKGFRSTTLTAAGICALDLGKELDPADYSLRIRLIVGGPNEGCAVSYDWIRFVTRDDAAILTQHPDFSHVIPDFGWGSR